MLVEVAGSRLLFDPFISPNPAAAGIEVAGLKPDFVLVSHGHEDHVADVEAVVQSSGALLVSNFEVVNWFQARGVEKAQPLNHGGGCDLPFGRVAYVNAVHSSSMPDGSYGGNPGGFVVETAEGNFYFSGDTALSMDMKMLGERHDLDWAALCLGDTFTMGPRDAATAAQWVGVRKVLGLHFDTFPPIEIDHEAARGVFSDADVALTLAKPGEVVEF